MTLRPAIPVVLLAALIMGIGLENWSVSQAVPGEILSSSTPAATDAMPPAGMGPASAMAGDGAVVVARKDERQPALGGLGAQDAAMLAEQVAVQLLVKESALDLTPQQWTAFAAVTWHYQTVRQTFEATIATVSTREKSRLEIPAYPDAGDALREKFYAELQQRLGDDTAQLIADRAGAALEGYFGGFGVGLQILDFAPNAGVTGADYQVTRTAQYWNSVKGRERLTLRRETHFPTREDPNGDRWGPYLAVLATGGTE